MIRHNKRKIFIIIAAIALVCASSVGAYYAAVTEGTNVSINTFELGSITCEINEKFDKVIKSDVAITNTSEIATFVRANIIVSWATEDRTGVYSEKPILNTDYAMIINNTDWFIGTDGYYYYKNIVPSGDATTNLIESASLLETANEPDGFYLSIEIISSAIQANPKHAVADAWKVVEWNDTELVAK